MATSAYIGEIRPFAFPNAPKGWAACNGQLLPINQYQALFAILSTTYGGDGQTTFALPNLQGRTPIHVGTGGGSSYTLGQAAGSANVSLAGNQIASHLHVANGTSNTANSNTPSTSVLPGTAASTSSTNFFTTTSGPVTMGAGTIANAGAGQQHENRQPSLAVNLCICLQGLFPPRS